MEPVETHGNCSIQIHETALKVVRFDSVNEPYNKILRKRLEWSECDKSGSTRMDCDYQQLTNFFVRIQSGTGTQKATGRKDRIKNLLKLEVSSFPYTTTQFSFAFPNRMHDLGRNPFWRLGSTANARLDPGLLTLICRLRVVPVSQSYSKNRTYLSLG